jgi:hypothetical protein
MKYFLTIFSILIFFANIISAQDTIKRKSIEALRTNREVQIDGLLNEPDWNLAPIAGDFVDLEPVARKQSVDRTEVKLMYDDKAIYISAIMYDGKPDSIARELTSRDDIGNSDWFMVAFDTYKDGQNGSEFIVQATNVQFDAKIYVSDNNGEDQSWNAVWNSNVSFKKNAWIVEMAIPYSALRFPVKDIQQWRVNFGRLMRRTRRKSFWNEIIPTVSGFATQFGNLEGLKNIVPPIRLSATPFLATYVEDYSDKNNTPQHNTRSSINGGMDVKYGINDAYTLDMTLIPDFGQVRSDNQVLNLSPFEVQFDENRQFFTEGIELFNKGNLLYSRRIGSKPLHYNDVKSQLEDNEKIVSNPQTQRLYNATKVSGRNSNGLGLGILNAVAAPSYAVVENTNGEKREIQTSALTNYNVLSVDKTLKYNSYVTFVNTSVLRQGSDYDANVTGGFFDLKNKKNSYGVGGRAVFSQIYNPDNTDIGHQIGLNASKISGNLQYGVGYNEETENYNPNDMGFLRSPNEQSVNVWAYYGIFKPFSIFNKANFNMWANYNKLYKPNVFTGADFGGNFFFFTKKFLAFGTNFNIQPTKSYDYFEPRTEDYSKYIAYNPNFNINFFISTNYAKKFAWDCGSFYYSTSKSDLNGWGWWAGPRYRFNDKFSMNFNTNVEYNFNDRGYIRKDTASFGYNFLQKDDILIGVRNRFNVENILNIKYTFNAKLGITFRLRHYWSRVNYNRFDVLENDGLLRNSLYSGEKINQPIHNRTYDAFNIDMVTTWRFAPGSDLVAVWKQGVYGDTNIATKDYFHGLGNVYNNPITNSISLKMIYYIDYLYFAKKTNTKTASKKESI